GGLHISFFFFTLLFDYFQKYTVKAVAKIVARLHKGIIADGHFKLHLNNKRHLRLDRLLIPDPTHDIGRFFFSPYETGFLQEVGFSRDFAKIVHLAIRWTPYRTTPVDSTSWGATQDEQS